MSKLIDLTGEVFGRLTVIKRHPMDYVYKNKNERLQRQPRWIVKCDCGKYRVINGRSLRGGDTQSCGCWQKERVTVDVSGQVFGNWKVLEKSDQRRVRTVMWKCQCLKCGRIKNVSGDQLRDGGSTQCQSCANRESSTIHGLSYTKEYKSLENLIRREYCKSLDSEWTIEMEQLLCDLQPRCVICNAKAQATDHVLPLSKGYGLKPGNAVRLCVSCNSTKSNKLLSELPEIWQHRLTMAAESFRCEWESHISSVSFA